MSRFLKATLYVEPDQRFVVEPVADGVKVIHEVGGVYCIGWAPVHSFTLRPDLARALVHGLELALGTNELDAQREAGQGA